MNKFSLLLITLAFSLTTQADNLQIQKENDEFFSQLDQIVQNVTPRKNSRWGVSKLSLNTSKTSGGLLGLMPFSGTVASTLSWVPKNASSQSLESKATDIKSFSLANSEDDGQLAATTWYREFFRAKKLPWSSNNEIEFLQLFAKARSIAQDIANMNHPDWFIEQFVVERGLTVKGTVAPLTTLEAQYAIRFSFDLQSAKKARANNTELTNLVLGLAEDLSSSAKQFSLSTWSIDGFNLGLGVSPLLGIGVVNAKPFAFAHMKFKAKKTKGLMTTSMREQIRQATSQNIKMFDYSAADTFAATAKGEKYFIINREKFRKGLAASLKMAKEMTVKADKPDSDSKKWRLGQVTYRFEMGVNGTLNLVALKGKVGAEITLNKSLARVKNLSSTLFNVTDTASVNQDLKQSMKTEMQDNYTVITGMPASSTLSGIESLAFLKISWGIDTTIVDLKISAIPQVRLKFSPLQ